MTFVRSRLAFIVIVIAVGYVAGRLRLDRWLLTAPELRSESPAASGAVAGQLRGPSARSTLSAIAPPNGTPLLPDPWREKLTIGERLALADDNFRLKQAGGGGKKASAHTSAGEELPMIEPIRLPSAANAAPFPASYLAPGPSLADPRSLTKNHDGGGAADPSGFSTGPTASSHLPQPSALQRSDEPTTGRINVIAAPSSSNAPAGEQTIAAPISLPSPSALPRDANTIRIATWDLGGFSEARFKDPISLKQLVLILQQFDIIAVQGIRSKRDDVLPRLVAAINADGRAYDYLIGPRVGRGGDRQQLAFLFDTHSVETDRFELYTVDDPQDLLTYEPLVAWFRCKTASPAVAFTFSLVNCSIAPHAVASELGTLPALISALAQDGRQEDDWILAGGFASSADQMTNLEMLGAGFVNDSHPTDLYGTRMTDNLVFPRHACVEFTGSSGVFDFLRRFNLSDKAAAAISAHLPVWGEFSRWEGKAPAGAAILRLEIQR